MALFMGTFINKVDAKGRVSVPAPFRAKLTRKGLEALVAFPSLDDDAIEAGGEDYVEGLGQGMGDFNPMADEYDDFAMSILAQAQEMAFDGAGRIILPKDLLDHAGITDKAAFVGMGKKIMIWEPARLEARMEEARNRARQRKGQLRMGDKGASNAAGGEE